MRTTVTLDPDVEARLREVARERGVSFEEALSIAIRADLTERGQREYRTPSRSLGLRSGVNLGKALSACVVSATLSRGYNFRWDERANLKLYGQKVIGWSRGLNKVLSSSVGQGGHHSGQAVLHGLHTRRSAPETHANAGDHHAAV